MKNKIFLTSMCALAFATHAMADNNSNYTENSQYGGSCAVGNLGTYDSSTNIATANFAPDSYQCSAGEYLPTNEESCSPCPAGSFCDSSATYTFSTTNPQGATSCPNGYANSASGAKSNAECYRTCTNSDVAHSTGTVNGGMYYGDVNKCEPTDCVAGWTLKPGLDLSSIIDSGVAESSASVSSSGSFNEYGGHNRAYYGLTENNTWAVDFGTGEGLVYGAARCSSISGTDAVTSGVSASAITIHTTTELNAGGSGDHCYCNITGYKKSNDAAMQSLSSSNWVLAINNGSCGSCAYHCADRMRNGVAFRTAMFNAVGVGLASCEANTITVRWGDGTPNGVHEETMCTYGGTLYTPTTAPTAPKGHHFTGWTFDLSALTTNNSGND